MSQETMEFQTEIKQLLDIMINSLYTNKEIFLRELISNSSDALDKVRFLSQTNQKILEGNSDLKITLEYDEKKKTVTLSDNGIGMTRKEVVENIGTIAKSGTKGFLDAVSKSKKKDLPPELIGQFGVGFYSSFMVADTVTVETRSATGTEGTRWVSKGDGKFTIDTFEKESRGTDIILKLKKVDDEEQNFATEWVLRSIVKKYSDFVKYPVCMDIEREEMPKGEDGKPVEGAKAEKIVREETLNSMKPLWVKRPSEINDDEYKEFYKHISHDWNEPAERIHVHAEGRTEYTALMYFPSKLPFDFFTREAKSGIQLYAKQVFIMDSCDDLIPSYLRFVKGVVDSADLSLNVSREMLQKDKFVAVINKNLTKKVLEKLKNMQEKEFDKYLSFYKEFGKVLKEGVSSDFENKEKLEKLLIFESSKSDTYTSLKDYVERMPKEQKEIYYITGENKAVVEKSPHLEMYKSKDYEVLFLTDPIDEWVVQAIAKFDEKQLKSVVKGDADLLSDSEKKKNEKETKEDEEKYSSLLEFFKNKLKDNVKDVRISKRLTGSPVCLVADENDASANMERILQQLNQTMPPAKRILEINPKHELLMQLSEFFEKDKTNPVISDYIELLYDQALLTEGSQISDPVSFSQKVSRIMLKAAKM